MCFSSGVYLYFRILMYVKRHEHFEIGCGAILNKIYSIIIGHVIDHLSDICERDFLRIFMGLPWAVLLNSTVAQHTLLCAYVFSITVTHTVACICCVMSLSHRTYVI